MYQGMANLVQQKSYFPRLSFERKLNKDEFLAAFLCVRSAQNVWKMRLSR